MQFCLVISVCLFGFVCLKRLKPIHGTGTVKSQEIFATL